MVTVIGTTPFHFRDLPHLARIHPVDMIYQAPLDMCSICHQLAESHFQKSLGHKSPWVLLEALVQVTSNQSSFT